MNNMKHFFGVVVLIGCMGGVCFGAEESKGIRFEKTSQGIGVFEGDTPVAFYQARVKRSEKGTHPRNNYLHPVYGLDGQVLTEDFPKDHAHHRGIFWTWHQMYVGEKAMGDAWECRDFVWDIGQVNTGGLEGGPGAIWFDCLWKSPALKSKAGELVPFVRESTEITFYPKTETYRVIDFSIELTALVDDVKLGGSKDSKGYSGFSTRVRLSPTTRFTSSTGVLAPQKDPLGAGPWVDFSHPAVEGWEAEGVAILQHPSNPKHVAFADGPQPWILRQQRSMQNAAWPGSEAVGLPGDGEAIVLRYRLVIHRGDLGAAVLNRLQGEYASGE